MTTTHITENSMPDSAMIDDLLDDLDLDMGAEDGSDDALLEFDEAIEENLAPETKAIVEKQAEAALDMDLAKLEAYEETSDAADISLEPEAPSPTPKRARSSGARGKGRDLSSLPAELFVLTAELPADLEINRAAVIAARPTVKKVAEKFDNFFQCLAAGKQPSVYVTKAFEELDSKKTVAASDIIKLFEQSGYSKGTASSQAGQIMALFAALQIAKRNGNKLTLVDDSPLAAALRALS